MTSHTVRSYDNDLSKVKDNIVNMTLLVRDMINIADRSLQQSHESFVDLAHTTDEKINKLDIEIEKKAISILALRQPMAIDLRESIAALKMAVILERMGDLAKHISDRVNNISDDIDHSILKLVHEMASININRIEDVVKSYQESDIAMAKIVFLKDTEIDAIYKILMTQLEELIIASPSRTRTIMKLIFAVKNLERIGDYISKLATLVNYIISGNSKIS